MDEGTGPGGAGPEGQGWDEAVAAAWQRWWAGLADRAEALDDGASLVVEPGPDARVAHGLRPRLRVTRLGEAFRVEAVGAAPLLRAGGPQAEVLAGLGWKAPTGDSPHPWAEMRMLGAKRAAVLVMRTLREVYAVLHPAYLAGAPAAPGEAPEPARGSGWGVVGAANGSGEGAGPADPAAAGEDPDEQPVRPRSHAELVALLVRAVAPYLDTEPEPDERGDLSVPTAHNELDLITSPRAPRVLLHACLVEDVQDEDRCLVEVNRLNTENFGLTFALREERVVVLRELPLRVFTVADLRGEVGRMLEELDGWTRLLLDRVGGRGPLDPEAATRPARRPADPADQHLGLATKVLGELERHEPGSVDTATIVRIFDADPALLVRAIERETEEMRRWRKRRRSYAEGTAPERMVRMAVAAERRHAELRTRLRRALRVAVLAQAGRRADGSEQLELFDGEETLSAGDGG